MMGESGQPTEEEVRRVHAWELAERARRREEYRIEAARLWHEKHAELMRRLEGALVGRRIDEVSAYVGDPIGGGDISMYEIALHLDDGTEVEFGTDEHQLTFQRLAA